MTAPDLAALSAAATQGEWKVIFYDAGDCDFYDHNGPTPGIFSEEADCGIVHWDGFKQKYWTSANGNQCQIEANAALITTLVNEYRAGRLVQIDEGMREATARAEAAEAENARLREALRINRRDTDCSLCATCNNVNVNARHALGAEHGK